MWSDHHGQKYRHLTCHLNHMFDWTNITRDPKRIFIWLIQGSKFLSYDTALPPSAAAGIGTNLIISFKSRMMATKSVQSIVTWFATTPVPGMMARLLRGTIPQGRAHHPIPVMRSSQILQVLETLLNAEEDKIIRTCMSKIQEGIKAKVINPVKKTFGASVKRSYLKPNGLLKSSLFNIHDHALEKPVWSGLGWLFD